jgi:Phage integrase family
VGTRTDISLKIGFSCSKRCKNIENEPQLDETPYSAFTMAIRSPITRQKYLQRLGYFLSFLGINNGNIENRCNILGQKSKADLIWLTSNVIKFLQMHRQRVEKREISAGTLRNYIKPIKLFCEQADISLPWKRITRGMPRGRRYASDRVPTFEEIQKIIEYPGRRIKAIVYTMTSSGIRLGSFDYLKWKHIIPMYNNDSEIIASKIIVYAGDNEEYYSFITSEAYMSLKDWMDFRASYGENISGESWLMRDLWQTTNIDFRYRNGFAMYPKRLKSSGIKRLIERALWDQGLRRPLKDGQKRHEWKAAHGFRKFFTTQLINSKVNPEIREILLGHKIGLASCYYRPTEAEMLAEYEKAIDLLIINEENRLRKKVEVLTIEKSKVDLALTQIEEMKMKNNDQTA